jgi:hypothetical protein
LPSEAIVQKRGQHCPEYPFDFPAEVVPYMDRRLSRELQADMKASEMKGHSASQWLKGNTTHMQVFSIAGHRSTISTLQTAAELDIISRLSVLQLGDATNTAHNPLKSKVRDFFQRQHRKHQHHSDCGVESPHDTLKDPQSERKE